MTVQAAIFDLDGVLVDTEPMHYKAWLEATKPYNVTFSIEEYADYSGNSAGYIENLIMKRHGIKAPRGTIFNAKNAALERMVKENHGIKQPFVDEIISFFKNKGVKMAVATGGLADETKIKLQCASIREQFDAMSTRSDVKRNKPFPDIYLYAAKALGIPPERCLAFDDTEAGTVSAVSAGMKCISVPTPFSRHQDFSKADAVARDLREALNIAKARFL